jgi:hypothetical protein
VLQALVVTAVAALGDVANERRIYRTSLAIEMRKILCCILWWNQSRTLLTL